MSCSVHDMIDYERRGKPSVYVASTEFVRAEIVRWKPVVDATGIKLD